MSTLKLEKIEKSLDAAVEGALGDTFFVRILDGIKIIPILVGILPVVVASALMAGAVYATRLGLNSVGIHPGLLSLVIEVVAGGVAYVGAAFIVARSLAMDIVQQLLKIIRRRRASPS